MERNPGIHALPPQKPEVVFQPRTYAAFQYGINLLADAIRPTLGPRPRLVAIERPARNQAAELLDDGGMIARRIIELPDRDASMGALLMRQALWRLHDRVGDGTATAALIFQQVFNRGLNYIAAGGNATRLRVYLEAGLRTVLQELADMAVPVRDREHLTQIAGIVCHDHELAQVLGQVMDMVGPYGQVDVRTGYGWICRAEYVEGSYWDGGLYAPDLFLNPDTQKAELIEPWIVVSDLIVKNARELLPVLDCATRANCKALVIVANQLSDQAIGLLHRVNQSSGDMRVIGVKTPDASTAQRAETMPDMSRLLGGRPFYHEAGETFEPIQLQDFGRARRAWANRTHFGIVGGGGDVRVLRAHLAGLRAAYGSTDKIDERAHILSIMGRLISGSATLWVGGMTQTEIETRKKAAERMLRVLRGAVLGGVVPGGGAALLACQAGLRRKQQEAEDHDERAAYDILCRALEAPTRAIVANAGYDPGTVMGDIRRAGPGCTFEALNGTVVNAACVGLSDPVRVARESLFTAVSSAAQALTIDVLVHHRKIKLALEP